MSVGRGESVMVVQKEREYASYLIARHRGPEVEAMGCTHGDDPFESGREEMDVEIVCRERLFA